ncbi:MAG: hypothetical protein ACRCUS_09150 [Anaerovoracaceae bacterium]
MAKKTFNEKLKDCKDLPKTVDLSDKPDFVSRYGGSKMYIASPLQYNEIIARIPEGKIITSDLIRAKLASDNSADVTCPLTAGIFINICAKAAIERGDEAFPWWRCLKAKGELNEKYPDGIDNQKFFLERDGFEIIQKGKRYFVKDYEKFQVTL